MLESYKRECVRSVQLISIIVKAVTPSSFKELWADLLTSTLAGQVEYMMLVFLLTPACIGEGKMVTCCLIGEREDCGKGYIPCYAW